LFCQDNHVLKGCDIFKNKSQQEKLDFLKETGVCFSCLKFGHISRECDNRLVCEVCNQTHPSVLHIHRKPVVEDEGQRSSLVSAQTCGHTGAGNETCFLSIIPVQVKLAKGDKIIKTYAFLDPGSSATFCSKQLMDELNIRAKRVNIFLHTMGQEQSVSCNVVTGLEISGINNHNFFSLPEVYVQKKMPVNSDNIVTLEEISKWPYLDRVKLAHIQANVDLLIGANASQVMEPWEVINSYGSGPYAIRTLLGWVVNGTSEKSGDCRNDDSGTPSVTVNRISMGRHEELFQIQSKNQDTPEDDLSDMEVAQASLIESEASEQEFKIKREEISVQDQVEELVEGDGNILTKSGVVVQMIKEEESFDSEEMDFKKSLDALLRNLLDQPIENFDLLKENSDPESKPKYHTETVVLQSTPNPINHWITLFTEWKRLKLAVAWTTTLRELLNRSCLKGKVLLAMIRNAKLLYPP